MKNERIDAWHKRLQTDLDARCAGLGWDDAAKAERIAEELCAGRWEYRVVEAIGQPPRVYLTLYRGAGE